MLYLETSAAVKALIEEPGSAVIRLLLASNGSVATSRATQPEARAALAAAERVRRITPAEHREAKEKLARILAWLYIVELDEFVAESAGDIAERFSLRGFDAIHLASALRLDAPVLATWDADLIRAGRRAGVAVATG
ncbi:MAG: type II toxin-antitoxin system VapC family toxin [Actinomycetota bacterium]